MKNAIIFNKPFSGSWLDTEGNIGHEIIDFILTDSGEHYVFNNPAGTCPNNIWVGEEDENSFGLKRTKKEEYTAKYLVLTSAARGNAKEPKTFKILYVIELKEKIHRERCPEDIEKQHELQKRVVNQIIEKRNIRYNDVLLHAIYEDRGGMFLAFLAGDTYKPKDPEGVLFKPEKFNFQRNKGYLYEDKAEADYNKLMDIIKDITSDKENKVELPKLKEWAEKNSDNVNAAKGKTFLDLLGAQYNEQAFTFLLAELLKNEGDNKIFKEFCKKFKEDREFVENEEFRVSAEKKVPSGRVDVCGESDSQIVIIENKIHSGLNGRKEDGTSQLSVYRKWIEQEKKKPLCFIAAPDFRVEKIKAEIETGMKSEFIVVSYSKIADFIKENKNNFKSDLVKPLIDQICTAFGKLGEERQEDFYAEMLYQATVEVKAEKAKAENS